MPTLEDLVTMLNEDSELQEMNKEAADKEAMEGETIAATSSVPAATPTTGAGVDGEVAGKAVETEIAGQLGDNPEDQKVKVKEQIMSASAKQQEAKALAEPDELPNMHQVPVLGEQLVLGSEVKEAMDKEAYERMQSLIEIGLEVEEEAMQEKVAHDNYLLGQVFGHGVFDFLNEKDPAFQKEASIIDEMDDYTEEEIDQALEGLDEEEITKISAAFEEKAQFDKVSCDFYALGQAYAQGIRDAEETKE